MPRRMSERETLSAGKTVPWTARNSLSLSAMDRPFRCTRAELSGVVFAGPGSIAKVGGGTSAGR